MHGWTGFNGMVRSSERSVSSVDCLAKRPQVESVSVFGCHYNRWPDVGQADYACLAEHHPNHRRLTTPPGWF